MFRTRKLCKVATRLSSRAPVRDLNLPVFNALRSYPRNMQIFALRVRCSVAAKMFRRKVFSPASPVSLFRLGLFLHPAVSGHLLANPFREGRVSPHGFHLFGSNLTGGGSMQWTTNSA